MHHYQRLKDGMDADAFAKELLDKLDVINQDDEVILLGDLVGGSPLTTAMDVQKFFYH